jgi:lipopolysaccharide/colanic/teichoic acid biosynthesis glycosyltransferase
MSLEASSEGRPLPGGLARAVEVPLAALGLAATSPLLLLAGLWILATSGLPILFRQLRIGRDGRPFTLVKLRTMRSSPNASLVTARGDPRITAAGRVLRRTKIDEIPQLWNVLMGDMAFVGPRPEVPEFVDLGDPVWRRILSARPGLTDPITLRLRDEEALMAAVSEDRDRFYRETLQPWKLSGYLDYLENRSWRTDLRVLILTGAALFGHGRDGPVPNPGAPPGP